MAPSFDYNTKMFTGHERDKETGLDYMLARYYGGSLPRFLSPDPIGGNQENPQTFNRYAYVGNNPLNIIDPTGLYGIDPNPHDGFQDPCDGMGPMCKIKIKPNTGDKKKDKEKRRRIKHHLKKLAKLDPRVKDLIKKLKKSDNVIVITDVHSGMGNLARADNWADAGNGTGTGSEIEYSPDNWQRGGAEPEIRNPEIGLLHELQHASDFDDGTASNRRIAEEEAVRRENQVRPSLGQPLRTTSGGVPVPNPTGNP